MNLKRVIMLLQMKRINPYLHSDEPVQRNAQILQWIQVSLMVLLLMALFVVLLAQQGDRRTLYIVMITGFLLLLGFMMILNRTGFYVLSSGLTAALLLTGPWLSVYLDQSAARNDFFPFVYIVLPVQMCAMFIPVKLILLIAAGQVALLGAVIGTNPNFLGTNWQSLLVFAIFALVLSIVTSFVMRRQMEQIDNNRRLLAENEMRLRELSVRDSLTGLFNRRYMEETLKKEIYRAERKKRNVSVVITDLDGFKTVNDTYGHGLGDAVLIQVADLLQSGIRNGDVACRYGGDEFVLILPECSLADTKVRAETLRENIGHTLYRQDEYELGTVTVSIGVSAYPENGSSPEELLAAADKALYIAKKSGRNRVVGFEGQIEGNE